MPAAAAVAISTDNTIEASVDCSGEQQAEIIEPIEEDWTQLDDLSRQLRQEALEALQAEPELAGLLHNTVLAPGVRTFEDAVACTVAYRLLSKPCPPKPPHNAATDGNVEIPMFCPSALREILSQALDNNNNEEIREAGHLASEAVRLDVMAVCERDPAVDTVLEVVLFLKGFAALVCHRAAYYKWHSSLRTTTATNTNNHGSKHRPRKSLTALWLQSQASAVFGVDIHPGATIGAGVLFDHGTGIVIGETATVGDDCTLLHGVTLGGTGKNWGDRHPKVGPNVLIGANASLLGNIPIGEGAKIGAGSVVLRPIPAHATAVGAPAKIVGRAREKNPGSIMDETLLSVKLMRKSGSTATLETAASTVTDGAVMAPLVNVKGSAAPVEDDNESSDETFLQIASSGSEGEESEEGSTNDNRQQPNSNHKKTKKKKEESGDTNDDICCPFRDYLRVAKSAPPGSITFCTLRSLLAPEGCQSCQIGEIMFALDTRNVGYLKPEAFFTDKAKQVMMDKTEWSAERVASMLDRFREKWQNSTSSRSQSPRMSLTHSSPPDISVSG